MADGNLSYGVPDDPSPDTGLAYPYHLGGRTTRNSIAAAREARQAAAEEAKEKRQYQNDALNRAHQQFMESLALERERLSAAREADAYSHQMSKMQEERRILEHSAQFRRFYGMLDKNDPNRNAQVAELFQHFPEAIKSPEIQAKLNEDDKELAAARKPELSTEEAKFLHDKGPGSKNYEAIRKQVQDKNDPNHMAAVLDFVRGWNLQRKSAGLPSDTAGMSAEEMDKFVTAKNQPTNVPPPSTPAAQNVSGWSNANVPPAQPAATTTPKPADAWLQGHFKTSGATSAAPLVADNDRNDISNILNESPETGFLSNRPAPSATPPSPQPKPTPAGATGPQFYPA